MIWRSDLSFIDDVVRTDVSEYETAFCHGKSESVFFGDVSLPNSLFSVIAVDV